MPTTMDTRGAVDGARQQVAAQLVGAQPVLRRGDRQRDAGPGVGGVVQRQQVGEHGGERQQHQPRHRAPHRDAQRSLREHAVVGRPVAAALCAAPAHGGGHRAAAVRMRGSMTPCRMSTEEVDDDEAHGEHDDGTLQRHEVAVVDRVDGEAAQTGQGEDALDQHGAADHPAHRDAGEGDDADATTAAARAARRCRAWSCPWRGRTR